MEVTTDVQDSKMSASNNRGGECSPSGSSIARSVFERQLAGTRLPIAARELLFSRLVSSIEETEFRGSQWHQYDKAFACAWLNSQQVAIGTKCNHLLLVDTETPQNSQTLGIQDVALPAAPPRSAARNSSQSASFMARPSSIQNALWTVRSRLSNTTQGSSPGSATDGIEDEEDLIANMIQRAMSTPGLLGQHQGLRPQDDSSPPPRPGLFQTGNEGIQVANCGIHCIAMSPCNTMLACGGRDPSDCQVFRSGTSGSGLQTLLPAQTLVGHSDWIFGCAWITDRHVVTGSRDSCLKLWEVDTDKGNVNTQPLRTVTVKDEKVRDVKYLQQHRQVASLTVDGCVQLWDPHLNTLNTVATNYTREVVCMAASDTVLAVGSQNHVSFIDPRLKQPASSVPNKDHNHGVRSLAFSHQLLSVGGGQGRMHFWDMRAGKYLELGFPGSPARKHHLQTGPGYLLRDEVYMSHFAGMGVQNACYAHAWDPTETKLLTVGGPLAFGLTGAYAALWQ